MNNGTRPKLELQLNETATVKLLRSPIVGSNAYGEYWLLPVEHNGTEKSFFATREIYQQVSELKLGAGDTITLKKVAIQNGRKVSSGYVLEVQPRQEQKVEDDNLKQVLLKSIRDASDIVKEAGIQFSNDELQKLATTLFIQRTRLA